MKPGIHPEYKKALITCACGRVTETRSAVGELHVEICSHCHPFFTGRQKLVDTAGRVERFMAKYGIDGDDSEMPDASADGAGSADAADAADGARAAADESPEAVAEPVEEAGPAAEARASEAVEAPEAAEADAEDDAKEEAAVEA